MIVAHRGFAQSYPENTRTAVLATDRCATAHGIEIDVRVSRDGVPFLMHDILLKRTTGCDALCDECEWLDIEKLDAGDGFAPPSLAWVLENTTTQLLLDIKCERKEEIRCIVAEVDRIDGALKRCWFQTQCPRIVPHLPATRIMFLIGQENLTVWREQLQQICSGDKRCTVSVNICFKLFEEHEHRDFMKLFDRLNVATRSTWTLNDAKSMASAFRVGYHVVVTDIDALSNQ